MDEAEILSQLETMARMVFGRDDVSLTRETTRMEIEQWDSLTQMQWILAVENQFGIALTLRQMAGISSVGDLVDAVQAQRR